MATEKKEIHQDSFYKIFVIACGVIILLSLGFAGYSYYKSTSDKNGTDSADINEPKPIMKVGEEYIYESTFDAYAIQMHLDPVANREKILAQIEEDSVLLQYHANFTNEEINPEIFNGRDINITYRISTVDSYSVFLSSYEEPYFDIEAITIFFWNSTLPEYAKTNGVEAAKALAYSKIEPIYQDIITNNTGFQDAAKAIIADPIMEELNNSYIGNAYVRSRYTVSRTNQSPIMVDLQEFAQNAEAGDISQIILGKDIPYDSDGKVVEAYYTIYKLITKANSIGEEIAQYKSNLEKEIYE